MKVTSDRDSAPSVKRSVTIENGPILKQSTSSAGKVFQVERLWLTYSRNAETGNWEIGQYDYVSVGGHVLKKNGEPSLQYHHQMLGKQPPMWVDHIVNMLRPHGAVSGLKIVDLEVSE